METPIGKNCVLQVCEADTGYDLTSKVYADTGIPPQQQNLMWNNKRIHLGLSLSEQGIICDVTVRLLLNLKGGSGKI